MPGVLWHILQHFLCRISPPCPVGSGCLLQPVAPGPLRGGRVGFPSVQHRARLSLRLVSSNARL